MIPQEKPTTATKTKRKGKGVKGAISKELLMTDGQSTLLLSLQLQTLFPSLPSCLIFFFLATSAQETNSGPGVRVGTVADKEKLYMEKVIVPVRFACVQSHFR